MSRQCSKQSDRPTSSPRDIGVRRMCGVAGVWDRRGKTGPDSLAASVKAMTKALAHRGPDAGDVWIDQETGLALGHRRLSIVDLSPAGAHPVFSPSGGFVI